MADNEYRKRPVTVHAIQFDGSNGADLVDLADLYKDPAAPDQVEVREDRFLVHTLEGVMDGGIGWWLIIGVQGEPYPCKADIFDQTYEPVSD